jgi:hypothetical protein
MEPMSKADYNTIIKRIEELKDIEPWDSRCDEYNLLLDQAINYEDENNIYIARVK